jgi:hypothetical protein
MSETDLISTQQKDDVNYKKIRLAMANIFAEFIKGMIPLNSILQQEFV